MVLMANVLKNNKQIKQQKNWANKLNWLHKDCTDRFILHAQALAHARNILFIIVIINENVLFHSIQIP